MLSRVERTQIYLTAAQTRELDRRARAQGTTRSHLIRDAVQQYLGPTWDPERFRAALKNAAGIWADRDDIDEIHEELNRRSRAKLERYRTQGLTDRDREAELDR
jgi:Arc/MetJ-type ribon-helix-helix transcriptional regulator